MDYVDIKGWFEAAKAALALLNAAKDAIPKGKPRDEAEAKIHEAESAMKKADAALANELGYRLCKCEFPPTPMLWREAEKAEVCPRCGQQRKRPDISGGDKPVNYHYR